jgi:glycosyltransferase involved in cell wall biosynthesis
MPSLSVVIPAYNEAERISPTLHEVCRWLGSGFPSHEILVVDDGSTDGTSRVVGDAARSLPAVRLLAGGKNRGKGHAVRTGMLAARGRTRLFLDADHSVSIAQLPGLLDALAAGADVAIGSRWVAGASTPLKAPWYRRAWGRLGNRVVRAGLLGGIADTQCGFKVFTAEAADAIFSRAKFCGWGFDIEVLALARALGFAVVECPVEVRDDRRSRVRPIRDAVGITVEFARIRSAFANREYDLPPLH